MVKPRPSHISSLPLEVLEKIIEDINGLDDRQVLVDFSLSSKLFLRLCRAHLFRNVKLFLEPGPREAQGHPSSVQFIAFLASDPDVASQIRSLHIVSSDSNHPHSSEGHRTAVIEHLFTITSKLSHLCNLVIQFTFFTNWSMIDSRLKNVINGLYSASTLRYLELNYLELTTTQLLSLLRIPEVTLIGVSSIEPVGSEEVLHHQGSQTTQSAVHNLKIVMRRPNMARFLANIVRDSSKSLKRLEWLSSPYHEMEKTQLECIILRDLPELLSITICIPLDESGIGDLVTLFGSAKGGTNLCRLESIHVVCDYKRLPDRRSIDDWNWRGVDSMLIDDIYESLRTMKVSVKRVIYPKHRQPSNEIYRNMLRELLDIFREKLFMTLNKGVRIEGA
ncbi:hypothetical protein JR316_0011063 [Psilocybe cubensis]|uniref:F-box domain-containing protein n=2 Tax=Psilocybe cubensis TaxID=181762 RepID=A0A8H8CF72_PSICU|nr:hypothetical protein JR316_0011063 [Psilocybe cubensis]KAH9477146.1 hypothetical protein JR316_0011063 [Psilocybe cubensis]